MSEPDQPAPVSPGTDPAVDDPDRNARKADAPDRSDLTAERADGGSAPADASSPEEPEPGDSGQVEGSPAADAQPQDAASQDAASQDAASEDAGPEGPGPEGAGPPETGAGEGVDVTNPGLRRMRPTRLLVVLLLVLLGFSLAVQVRSISGDPTLAALGQEDLVRILANLDAHEDRLREEIEELEASRRRLSTADQSQQVALDEAQRRADELGILAGTLPAEGPGLVVSLRGGPEAVSGARLLDAVQELRGAGAEAMQIQGVDGPAVRVVASTYFGDADGGVVVDGNTMRAPYTLTVIGDPQTLAPALNLPGGVVESVQRGGGTVAMHEESGGVQVTAVRAPVILQHAQTVS